MDNHRETGYKITILCGDTEFAFPLEDRTDAWYSLDGAESRNGNQVLRLNADRDVYAVYTDREGTDHYGTVGNEENEVLADNDGICDGDCYYFCEKPETKDYYV